jgi:hypothetical protein
MRLSLILVCAVALVVSGCGSGSDSKSDSSANKRSAGEKAPAAQPKKGLLHEKQVKDVLKSLDFAYTDTPIECDPPGADCPEAVVRAGRGDAPMSYILAAPFPTKADAKSFYDAYIKEPVNPGPLATKRGLACNVVVTYRYEADKGTDGYDEAIKAINDRCA